MRLQWSAVSRGLAIPVIDIATPELTFFHSRHSAQLLRRA